MALYRIIHSNLHIQQFMTTISKKKLQFKQYKITIKMFKLLQIYLYIKNCNSNNIKLQFHPQLALSHRPLLTSPSYLFMHYKRGINMGKPMGRHPIPVT